MCRRVAAYLTVFYGNGKWEFYEVAADPEQQALLIKAEAAFWACVQDGTAPMAVKVKVVIPYDDMIEVDATEASFANHLSVHADEWGKNQEAAKVFKVADKELKDAMDDGVKRLHGFGVEVVRGKSGSRRVKALNTELVIGD